MQQAIVILGGTFDPVHVGHLRSAIEVAEFLGVEQVRLVPANNPAHRSAPACSPEQRLKMLQLATANEPKLLVDSREYLRSGPSYMVETLISLRQEFGETIPVILVLGMDAFLDLSGWYRWLEIPELAHLLLLARPGNSGKEKASDELQHFLERREVKCKTLLLKDSCGSILVARLSQIDVSASYIRNAIRQNKSIRYLVPDPVFEFIKDHKIYRPTGNTNI
jgi:nicotinate-nucleotide adenylyltransferase